MKRGKKNIDQFFKDAFEDFKQGPPEEAWSEILKQLDNRPKRRVIFPLWLKLSGVAAGLILLLTLYNIFSIQPAVPAIVHQETPKEPEGNELELPLLKETPSDNSKEAKNNSKEKQIENKSTGQEIVETATSPTFTEQIQVGLETKKSNNLTEDKHDLSQQITQNTETNSSDFQQKDLADLSEKEVTASKDTGISIFEDIAKNETPNENNIDLSEQHKNRFSVQPNIAPVLYGSLSGGSALDANLADNSAQSEWSVSYGINVAYELNKKVEIRTGINKLNLSYNTADVAFVPTSIGERLNALAGNANSRHIAVLSKEMQSALKSGDITKNMISSLGTGQINQSLEYIEIPVEIAVKVIDEQFELNVIGGASTLWLTNDQVHINSDMMNGDAGRANNIKNTSFTANMGVGANYNFNSKWGVSIEPTFKYQIEGFKGKDIQFKPYYFGIYSGIKYRF